MVEDPAWELLLVSPVPQVVNEEVAKNRVLSPSRSGEREWAINGQTICGGKYPRSQARLRAEPRRWAGLRRDVWRC